MTPFLLMLRRWHALPKSSAITCLLAQGCRATLIHRDAPDTGYSFALPKSQLLVQSHTHAASLFHVHASCSTASAASERPQSLCCLPCWTVWDSVRCPLACWAARASTPHPRDPNCRCEARVALAMRPCREAKGGCTASQAPSHADQHQTSPLHQDSAVLPATSNIQMFVLLGRGIIISLLQMFTNGAALPPISDIASSFKSLFLFS